VVYAGDSTASDVAVVMVPLFGHVGGEDRTVGDSGVVGASALVAPRLRFGYPTRG
jgi:hypothetical protein